MAVYGVRPIGTRSYGDGAGAASGTGGAGGSAVAAWVITGDIAATGGASAAPEAIAQWVVTGSIAATGAASATFSAEWVVTGTITAHAETTDGFGLGDPTIRPPSEIIWVYDLTGTQVTSIGPYARGSAGMDALEYEVRAQERETLKWSMRADDTKTQHIAVDRMVRWRGIYFRITAVVPTGDGPRSWYDIEATALWAELADKSIDSDTIFGVISVETGLEALLGGTGWDYVLPEGVSGTYTMLTGPASVLALVREWAKITLHEVVFHTATRTVEYVVQQGRDRGIAFRYGKNLNSVKSRVEPPQATVLIAQGARDELTTTVEDFTYYTNQGLSISDARQYFTRTYRWSDISFQTQSALEDAAAAKMLILAQPKISYECSVSDLSRITGHPEDDFGIGDSVRARHPSLNIDVYARVVRIVRRPFEPTKNIVELSTLPIDVSTGIGPPTSLGNIREWELVKHDSPAVMTISTTERIVNIIDVEFLNGEAVFGYELDGTAAGGGTVTFTFINYETGLPIQADVPAPSPQRVFVAGVVHEVVSFALKEING